MKSKLVVSMAPKIMKFSHQLKADFEITAVLSCKTNPPSRVRSASLGADPSSSGTSILWRSVTAFDVGMFEDVAHT